MKSIIKNAILIVALGALIIMIIGIFLYDYMPNSTTVAKANTYEATSDTTKVLSDITTESQELFSKSTNDDSSSSATPSIVLKTYNVSSSDLKQYASKQEYEKGKSDPFGDWKVSDAGTQDGNTSVGTTPAPTSNEVVGDGTMYNSTHTK